MKASQRKKPGRKPLPASKRRKAIELSLPDHVIERAREIGGSNASRGAEIAIMAYVAAQ